MSHAGRRDCSAVSFRAPGFDAVRAWPVTCGPPEKQHVQCKATCTDPTNPGYHGCLPRGSYPHHIGKRMALKISEHLDLSTLAPMAKEFHSDSSEGVDALETTACKQHSSGGRCPAAVPPHRNGHQCRRTLECGAGPTPLRRRGLEGGLQKGA